MSASLLPIENNNCALTLQTFQKTESSKGTAIQWASGAYEIKATSDNITVVNRNTQAESIHLNVNLGSINQVTWSPSGTKAVIEGVAGTVIVLPEQKTALTQVDLKSSLKVSYVETLGTPIWTSDDNLIIPRHDGFEIYNPTKRKVIFNSVPSPWDSIESLWNRQPKSNPQGLLPSVIEQKPWVAINDAQALIRPLDSTSFEKWQLPIRLNPTKIDLSQLLHLNPRDRAADAQRQARTGHAIDSQEYVRGIQVLTSHLQPHHFFIVYTINGNYWAYAEQGGAFLKERYSIIDLNALDERATVLGEFTQPEKHAEEQYSPASFGKTAGYFPKIAYGDSKPYEQVKAVVSDGALYLLGKTSHEDETWTVLFKHDLSSSSGL